MSPEPALEKTAEPLLAQAPADTGVEPEAVAPSPAPTSSAPAVAVPDDALSEERANAERLARIIVSDIALYQPEKFAQAIADGLLKRGFLSSVDSPDPKIGILVDGLFKER